MVVGVKEGENAHEVVKALITSRIAWRFICFCSGPSFRLAFVLCVAGFYAQKNDGQRGEPKAADT